MKPVFLGGTDLYHHTSQGMCIAENYIIYTRFNTDSDATTYVIIDMETNQEVRHYDFKTLHSNSLTYNPDTCEIVAVSESHAFVFEFLDGEMFFKEDIIMNHNCPKIAYVQSEQAYYLGTSTQVFRSVDLRTLENVFSCQQIAINQGMGFDGQYLYIIWYRVGHNNLYVYDLKGKFIRDITLISNELREIEDVDFYNNQMYVNIANSGQKNGVYSVAQVHDFGKWEVDKKATCAKEGLQHHVCKKCEQVETVEIPATNLHKAGDWIKTKDPECEIAGEHIKKCKVCHLLMEKEPIPALGHTFGTWIRTKEPTVLEEGEKVHICSRCQKQETMAIKKLPSYVILNVKKLTMQKKKTTDCIQYRINKGDKIKRWSVDNPEILEVDQHGKVTALKRGTANVSVRTEGGASATVEIKVQFLPVLTEDIEMRTIPIYLETGDIYQLKTSKNPLTSIDKVKYKSTDKKVALVTDSGEIIAKKKGSCEIIAKTFKCKKKVKVIVKK